MKAAPGASTFGRHCEKKCRRIAAAIRCVVPNDSDHSAGGNMLRFFTGALLTGLCAVTLFSATSRADDNKCTIATKGDSDVAKACKEGGIKRAKATMKAMQKAAKDKGMKTECDGCHKSPDSSNWTLKRAGKPD